MGVGCVPLVPLVPLVSALVFGEGQATSLSSQVVFTDRRAGCSTSGALMTGVLGESVAERVGLSLIPERALCEPQATVPAVLDGDPGETAPCLPRADRRAQTTVIVVAYFSASVA